MIEYTTNGTLNPSTANLNIIENQLKQYELKNESESDYGELQLIDKHKLHRDYTIKFDFGDVEVFRDISLCDDKIFKFEFGTYSIKRGKKNVAFKFKVYLEDIDVAKSCGEAGVKRFKELVKLFKKISENCRKNAN